MPVVRIEETRNLITISTERVLENVDLFRSHEPRCDINFKRPRQVSVKWVEVAWIRLGPFKSFVLTVLVSQSEPVLSCCLYWLPFLCSLQSFLVFYVARAHSLNPLLLPYCTCRSR